MIKGTEVFIVQKALYKRLKGFFGLSPPKKTDVAVALDSAVIFGMLKERHFPGTRVDSATLETMLRNKMARLGVSPEELGELFDYQA